MTEPTHGWTKLGHAVHGRTTDHLPTDSWYQRVNKKVAVAVTEKVGTMTCAWVFCLIALLSLPATLAGFSLFKHAFPSVLINQHLILLVAWVAQTFVQLVLLAVIMVGQSVQSSAADARAALTFDHTNTILDRLDTATQGGITEILDRLPPKKG